VKGLSPSANVTDILTNPNILTIIFKKSYQQFPSVILSGPMWIKKVIHIYGVHNYILLYPYFKVHIIMDNMTDKILDGLIPKVDCMDNSCTVRYYGEDGGLALGVIRFTITKKTDGKIPQDIIIINSMDLDGLLGYVMGKNNLSTNMGDSVVYFVRSHSTKMVKDHLR
jgi:hypothetical protein